ncbi:MAG TPA: hypothetical protein VJY33_05740, partial [Isosphaeraceae bacterium]|nr:hypothetical protein [Isosphaeraceae bacterium]
VLEVLAGLKRPSEIARQHKLKPELIARWKDIALEGLETLFQGEKQRSQDVDRIAELERMVGRLTIARMPARIASGSSGQAATTPQSSRKSRPANGPNRSWGAGQRE